MRTFVRSGLSASLVLGALAAATAQAQSPPATKGTAPAPARSATPPANLKQVLATVNGEPITRSDLLDLVVRYQVPLGDAEQRKQVYDDGIDTLANTKLINQFLARQKIEVSNQKIDAEIERLKSDLKAEGQDLATALLQSGKSIDDVRSELANVQRWMDYVKLKGTDAELKKFAENNKDLFSNTQVRASHILLKAEPDAPKADREKVRQRLLQIKNDILAKKYTFAQAANKLTEDERKAEGDGGDIGYFAKNGGILEEFADAAFKLKVGDISDPVETGLGYHLITVTDRKEGPKFDFEAKRDLVLRTYSMELQKQILSVEKAKAKIEKLPMPADLFPAAAEPSTPAGATPKAATPKP